jgi:hypothetical protein
VKGSKLGTAQPQLVSVYSQKKEEDLDLSELDPFSQAEFRIKVLLPL